MYLYQGLKEDDAKMINASSGGGFINKTPTASREMIQELAEGSRQFMRRSQGKKNTSPDTTELIE